MSGIGLAAVSCAAIVGAWRIGEGSHAAASAGGQVLSPPTVTSPSSGPSRRPAPRSATPSGSTPTRKATRKPAPSPPTQKTVDGALVSTQFGNVQVRIVLTAGRLTDVTALHLTDSSSRSVSISAQAAPILRSEALAAGSAKIDTVSGASYTSQAYIQSLQSALDTARAAA